jgi:hypothetical protein
MFNFSMKNSATPDLTLGDQYTGSEKSACSCCGLKADVLALYKGQTLCYECLVKEYPGVASLLGTYLLKSRAVYSQ